MTSHELAALHAFAQDIAHQAGVLTLGYFKRSIEVITKSDDSPVTVADREAEALIRRAIEHAYPDHGIIGEEWGVKEARNGCSYRWVIDPIDGTKSFIHGVPLYTTLLGLLRGEESVVGVLNVPPQNELISAAPGTGALLNGRAVRVSRTARLSDAIGLTTDVAHLGRMHQPRLWQPLLDGCKWWRTWGDAYGHFLVASGRAEFMLDAQLAVHDCACLPIIMREAGGAFFDWTGRETVFGGHGISTNGALRQTVLDAVTSKDAG